MRRIVTAALCALILTACSAAPDLPPLPKLNLEPNRTSVSGISSGAYLAQQLHLAYSDRLIGAALFAGGPYGCAQGDLDTALASCLRPSAEKRFNLPALVDTVRERSASGALAPLAGLQGDRVLVWHGQADALVAAEVSEASAALYEALGQGLELQRDFERPIAHLFSTAASGADCSTAKPPYIAACAFDAAGAAIAHLYGVSDASAQAAGSLQAFDARVGEDDPPGDPQVWAYIPAACAAGERCALHIALHGCEQSFETIGDAFIADAGYNRWADAAKLVVLYPQAVPSLMPLNPKGCWDWWGYSGADYDTRSGAQPRWIAAMARALGAPID